MQNVLRAGTDIFNNGINFKQKYFCSISIVRKLGYNDVPVIFTVMFFSIKDRSFFIILMKINQTVFILLTRSVRLV